MLQNYAGVFSAFKTVANTQAGYTHPTHSHYPKALYNSTLNICMVFIFIGILSLQPKQDKTKIEWLCRKYIWSRSVEKQAVDIIHKNVPQFRSVESHPIAY